MSTNALKVSCLPTLPSVHATVKGLAANRSPGNEEADISNDLPSSATLEEAILFFINIGLGNALLSVRSVLSQPVGQLSYRIDVVCVFRGVIGIRRVGLVVRKGFSSGIGLSNHRDGDSSFKCI